MTDINMVITVILSMSLTEHYYPVTALCSALCHVFQLANMILPEDENFLLIFRREAPLDNSVEFMKVRSQITLCVEGLVLCRLLGF